MNRNTGAAILAMGELSRVENQARDANKAAAAANAAAIHAEWRASQLEEMLEAIKFSAKSQIHWLRSKRQANIKAEDILIAALKDAVPNHPLADRRVVDEMVERLRAHTTYDEKVIALTFRDGNIPDGSIPMVDGSPGVCSGEPAFPARTGVLVDLVRDSDLTWDDLNDLDKLQFLIEKQHPYIAKLQSTIVSDDERKFPYALNKEKRAELENNLKAAERHLWRLEFAVKAAMEELTKKTQEEAETSAAKATLSAWLDTQGHTLGELLKGFQPVDFTQILPGAQGYSAFKRKEKEDAAARKAFLKTMDLDEEGLSDIPRMDSLIEQHQQKILELTALIEKDKNAFFGLSADKRNALVNERTSLKEKIEFTRNAIDKALNVGMEEDVAEEDVPEIAIDPEAGLSDIAKMELSIERNQKRIDELTALIEKDKNALFGMSANKRNALVDERATLKDKIEFTKNAIRKASDSED